METDDHGQALHHRLEYADDAGNAKAEEQQDDQPRDPLFHAAQQRLLQILLGGQTGQFRVILAHLLIDDLDDVLRGDDAQQMLRIIEHGDGVLRQILQLFDAVLDRLVVVHAGVGRGDQILQLRALAGDDQILEIDRAVERTVAVEGVQGGDIVVIGGLPHERAHGLLDRQILADGNVVRRHLAADLVIVVRADQMDILRRVGVHQLQQLAPLVVVELVEHVDGVVRVHALQHVGGALGIQFLDIRADVVQIGEHVAHPVDAEDAVQPLALALSQLGERLGDIAVVIVVEGLAQLADRAAAADQAGQFLGVVAVGGHGRLVLPGRALDLICHGADLLSAAHGEDGPAVRARPYVQPADGRAKGRRAPRTGDRTVRRCSVLFMAVRLRGGGLPSIRSPSFRVRPP